MEKILISDVHEVTKALEHDGYKLTYNQKGRLVFERDAEKIEVALIDYIDEEVKTVKPNYDNCALNVVASIRKHFGLRTTFQTNSHIDQLLATNKYKHIAILLLDGMGSYMLRKNLSEDSLLATHKISDMYAVFPSTTACAIPALQSGLAPLNIGWLGWENYFKEIDRHVVLFRNKDFYTNESLDFNVREKLPYQNFYADLPVDSFELGPDFYENGCATFAELCNRYLDEIKTRDSSVAYLYWNEPDAIMHETGCYSLESKKEFEHLDDILAQFSEKLPEDTLVIITADHGHINVKPIYLSNYTDITSTLIGLPSNEGRATFFRVKLFHRMKFEKNFRKFFGGYFKLLKRDKFINEGYLGKPHRKHHPHLKELIGDYVAIATDHYYFNYHPNMYSKEDDDFVFKSHHAGLTANEMMIPLIIIKK